MYKCLDDIKQVFFFFKKYLGDNPLFAGQIGVV